MKCRYYKGIHDQGPAYLIPTEFLGFLEEQAPIKGATSDRSKVEIYK